VFQTNMEDNQEWDFTEQSEFPDNPPPQGRLTNLDNSICSNVTMPSLTFFNSEENLVHFVIGPATKNEAYTVYGIACCKLLIIIS
jgi:hypothetical protein